MPLEIPGGWVRGRLLELSRVHDPGSVPISGRGTPVGRDVRLFLPISQPGASIGCIVIVCSSTSPSSTDDKVFVLRSRAYWHGGKKEENHLQLCWFWLRTSDKHHVTELLRAYIKHLLHLNWYMHLFVNLRGTTPSRSLTFSLRVSKEENSSQPTAAISLASI